MTQKAEPVISKADSKGQVVKLVSKHTHVLMLLVGVIVVVGALLIYNGVHGSTSACSTKVGKSLVDQAANNLTQADDYKLAPIALQIITLPHYQNDPNCMFVVTDYYVTSDFPSDAQTSLGQFEKLYNGHNVDTVLTNAMSVSALRNSVSNLISNGGTYTMPGLK